MMKGFLDLSQRRRFLGRWAAATLLLALIAGVACSGSDSMEAAGSADSGGDGGAQMRDVAGVEAEFDSLKGGAAAGSGGVSDESLVAQTSGDIVGSTGTAARLPRMGPSVIKTATLSLGVADDDMDQAISHAIAVAGRYGGFVLSSQMRGRDDGGTLTMRIPARRFEAALTDLEGLGKIRGENITGEDVGQEFVDLQARLSHWEAQAAVLLDLMDDAVSVSDTIRVQNELSRVQLQVEQLRGRLNFLRDQTAFGTITVTIGPLTPAKPDAPSRFAQAWERAVDLMQGFVSGAIVATGILFPLALIGLVLYLIFRGLRPRLSS
jgi:hypothetical protein